MPRNKSSYLNELSTSDLKKLLAARERIDVLEKERDSLQKKLASIEVELEQLVSGVDKRGVGRPRGGAKKKTRKKAGRKKVAKKPVKKVTKKKVGRPRKVTAKKAATKTVKKVGRPRKVTKKTVRQTVRKAAGSRRGGKVSLVDVVVGVLEKAGQPLAFKEILETIRSGKLYATKSKSFDNLLRKTLSSSDRFKRAGRGIYTLA
jgi:hypothetical protein